MKQSVLVNTKPRFNRASLLCSFLFLFGCSGLDSKRTGHNATSSSLASFLYPDKKTKVVQAKQIPQLTLPVKIGLAFLPSQHWRGSGISSSTEHELLNKVKQRFYQYRFIDEIKIIPSTYLRHKSLKDSSGFDTLTQVANLHDVDVIALVSYDQLTQSQFNNASLLYWTIVGMYVIPGNENTIQTFVDTAVFDVRSRKLLMRAPGINKLSKLSTAINVDRTITKKSVKGFNLAFDDMIVNLDEELLRFKDQVSNGKSAQVTNLKAYSAGGSTSRDLLIIMLILGFIRLVYLRRIGKPSPSL